jgi:hypothetical protein
MAAHRLALSFTPYLATASDTKVRNRLESEGGYDRSVISTEEYAAKLPMSVKCPLKGLCVLNNE